MDVDFFHISYTMELNQTSGDPMNYKLILNFSLLTGEIMLENGAETFRVEDTMSRILTASNCQTAECFVIPTGIFATLDDPDMESLTIVRRIKSRKINLNTIFYCESWQPVSQPVFLLSFSAVQSSTLSLRS